MSSKWIWQLRRLARQMWFRAALFAVAGGVASLASRAVSPWVPRQLAINIGADALETILTIIASSMLSVTTFSLGIMVSAYAAAASSVTPRATQILLSDTTTQSSLATFLGAFLYSLVAIIALKAGAYGEEGRLGLFLVTLGVIVVIFVTFIRWIELLRRFGRLTDTIQRVEKASADVLEARLADPYMGANRYDGKALPESATPVFAARAGYVQHVDLGMLSSAAEAIDAHRIVVVAPPGAFVHGSAPLAYVDAATVDDECAEDIRKSFTVGDSRDFSQDPRFGLIVLAEIASRALSPAVNDPGTAIDILGRGVRLLSMWQQRAEPEVKYPKLWMPPLAARDLFDDLFLPIARDGASLVEVHVRLQKALLALAVAFPRDLGPAAAHHARQALSRAEAALTIDDDKAVLRTLSAEVVEAAEFGSPVRI